MSELTRLEEQAMVAVSVLYLFEQRPDLQGAEFAGWGLFDMTPSEVRSGLDSLVGRGLLRTEDGLYPQTDQGTKVAAQLGEAFGTGIHDTDWPAVARSKAAGEFCEKVYGRNLSQTSFTDMEQLDAMIEALGLSGSNRVLDLGCGTGMIAEYISDQTEAHVTGLDYSANATQIARERCRDKGDRLSFTEGDMNDLDLPGSTFDAIVSIDTLYFAADLDRTVGDLKATLRPGGQMGIMYTTFIKPGEAQERLLPRSCPLGKALATNGLAFETHDCTENLRAVLTKMRDTAAEMKDAFEEEGFRRRYCMTFLEGDGGLRLLEEDRSARYLFLARLAA